VVVTVVTRHDLELFDCVDGLLSARTVFVPFVANWLEYREIVYSCKSLLKSHLLFSVKFVNAVNEALEEMVGSNIIQSMVKLQRKSI